MLDRSTRYIDQPQYHTFTPIIIILCFDTDCLHLLTYRTYNPQTMDCKYCNSHPCKVTFYAGTISEAANSLSDDATTKSKRFACYRAYVAADHGYLGRGNQVPIPVCIKSYIRDLYPDEDDNYTDNDCVSNKADLMIILITWRSNANNCNKEATKIIKNSPWPSINDFEITFCQNNPSDIVSSIEIELDFDNDLLQQWERYLSGDFQMRDFCSTIKLLDVD